MRLLFEGREVEVRPGDTVAAALLRAGETVFSRSLKYHRPRGAFCLSGTCTRCSMRVDGEPNVAACLVPARDGMRVERQNACGPDAHDLLRIVDRAYRQGLDYHHLMTHVRLLNRAAVEVARRMGATGRLADGAAVFPRIIPDRRAVVIIGGGPAGLAAAKAAALGGARPLVFEARAEAGGRAADGLADEATREAVEAILRDLPKLGGELVTGATVAGLWNEAGRRVVFARGEDRGWLVGADRVVVATGGMEQPMPFEGGDLPGIVAGRGLLRLARRHGVVPGRRAVVAGSDADAPRVAAGLRAHGVEVVALLDPDARLPAGCDEAHRPGWRPVRATGGLQVEAIDAEGPDGTAASFTCDLAAIVTEPAPAFELAAQAGASTAYRPAGFAVETDAEGRTSVDWLFAAGRVTGDPTRPLESGRRAGHAAALLPSAPPAAGVAGSDSRGAE